MTSDLFWLPSGCDTFGAFCHDVTSRHVTSLGRLTQNCISQ